MPRAKNKKSREWSYSAGERGVNRVRAYDRGARGLFLEWFEGDGSPGAPRKRQRLALGHRDRAKAKAKADELALAFRSPRSKPSDELTLATLFDIYGTEVTPHKGETSRAHDARCQEMFLRAFGPSRRPATLSRRDWDRFITDRRAGRIAPRGAKVGYRPRDQVIRQNLRFLLAVLNWATTAGDGRGGTLLDRNPLKGLSIPREESPRRAVCTRAQYESVRAAASTHSAQSECFVVLAWETGHRAASIRHLRWSDVDLEAGVVTWRGEYDKIGRRHRTPLSEEAVSVLRRERVRRQELGDAWIFPAVKKPTQPVSRDTMRNLWVKLAENAELPTGERFGWHSLRRGFANELRDIPLRDLQDLGGWTSPQAVLTCYLQPNHEAQRAALARRSRVAKSA